MSFERFMHEVLYAPGLGYYAAGSAKLSLRTQHKTPQIGGDFVTAPELTAAFGHVLARQIAQILAELSKPACATQTDPLALLEFGAGSGQLAHDVLTALGQTWAHIPYYILETSADLKSRQQHTLAQWGSRVVWLEALPTAFCGVVLANEVLDAMPVAVCTWDEHGELFEQGVTWHDHQLTWARRPARPVLTQALSKRMPPLPGYLTEINLQAESWVEQIGQRLKQCVMLMIDYGFVQAEYYHPQRQTGTLMCHIQHRAHDNPFFAPGLQDITAHVDFTAMADAATRVGLDVMGYTSQARFLLNAGLLDVLTETPDTDHVAIKKLVSEAEMGELFKVLAVGKGLPDVDLVGFKQGDRRAQLGTRLDHPHRSPTSSLNSL